MEGARVCPARPQEQKKHIENNADDSLVSVAGAAKCPAALSVVDHRASKTGAAFIAAERAFRFFVFRYLLSESCVSVYVMCVCVCELIFRSSLFS